MGSSSTNDLVLRLLNLADAEMTLAPAKPKAVLRRRFEILRHAVWRWWKHRNPIERIFYAFGWGSALLAGAIAHGLTLMGGIGIALVIIIRLRTAAKEFDPKHLPVLRRNYSERQLALEKLIHSLQSWMKKKPTDREVIAFQHAALELIASYMRDHRSDVKGRKIFANLLVRRGQAVEVIARSDHLRPVPQFYRPEECSLVWKTIETGVSQMTGDVYADEPRTQKGKKYNSIITMPIRIDRRTVGVVSIDSESKYHFDQYFEELQTELAPFVQLLAVSLLEDHDSGEPQGRSLPESEHQ